MRVRKSALRPLAGAGLLVIMLLVVPPLSSVADGDAVTHVHIQNTAFNPETALILVGESVLWHNHDAVPHTATANNGLFDSGTLNQEDTFEFEFLTAGTFAYHCQFHAGQTGTVIVVEPGALPDLIVSEIEEIEGLPGASMEIAVTVRNIGASPAGQSVATVSYAYGGELHLIDEFDVPVLLAGESHTGVVQWSTLGKLGDFVVVAEADAYGDVEESNEENNTSEALVSVLVSGVDGIDVFDPLPGL